MKKTPWLLKTYSGDVDLITGSLKYDINELKTFSANTVNDFSFVSSYSNNLSHYITENETNWGYDWNDTIENATSGKYDQSAFELLSGGFALKSAHSGSLTINGSTFDGSEDVSINITTGVTTTVSEITENTNVTLVAGQNRYLTCTNAPTILVEIADNNAYHLQINGSCTLALTGVSWGGDAITAITAKAEISILNNIAVGVLYE